MDSQADDTASTSSTRKKKKRGLLAKAAFAGVARTFFCGETNEGVGMFSDEQLVCGCAYEPPDMASAGGGRSVDLDLDEAWDEVSTDGSDDDDGARGAAAAVGPRLRRKDSGDAKPPPVAVAIPAPVMATLAASRAADEADAAGAAQGGAPALARRRLHGDAHRAQPRRLRGARAAPRVPRGRRARARRPRAASRSAPRARAGPSSRRR